MPRDPRVAYKQHKRSALYRSIEFLLTFEEWWEIWQASGKWEERGYFGWEYCMARNGDEGPYAVGNVQIITQTENLSNSWTNPDSWRNKYRSNQN